MYSFELLDCRHRAVRQRGVGGPPIGDRFLGEQRGGEVLAADELAQLVEPPRGLLDPLGGEVAGLGQVAHVAGGDLRRAEAAVGAVLEVEPDLGRGERQERRRHQHVAAFWISANMLVKARSAG